MLTTVELKKAHFAEYRQLISDTLFDEVKSLAARLSGKRVLHINATSGAGGVAEILRSEIPLLVDLGLKASWRVLKPEVGFFEITKMMHNGLQGDNHELEPAQWQKYQDYNRRLAESITSSDWDIIIVHDPQPAAVLSLTPGRGTAKWIWRCHIDSRHANTSYRERFVGYLAPYDGVIFTMQKYVLEGFKPKRLAVIPVAIDPLAPKNQLMDPIVARAVVRQFGINVDRPLVTQVSRFDPWKDPLGVIEAWELARRQIPELQLALVGDSSSDDPEGAVILEQVFQAAQGKEGLFVIASKADDRGVRAFQTHSDVIIQKSLREGFGLTVTEALWAKTPVIGTDVGGIPLQIQDGKSGYLVSGVDEAAERIVDLLRDPQKARDMGEYGHTYVGQHFLLPRLIRDELQFLLEICELG